MSNFNVDAKELKDLYVAFQNKSKAFNLKHKNQFTDLLKEFFKCTNCYCAPELNLDLITCFEDDYFSLRIFENYEDREIDFHEDLLLNTDIYMEPFREAYQERVRKQKDIDADSKLEREIEERELLIKLKAKYE